MEPLVMVKQFNFQRLFLLMSAIGTMGLSTTASAAAFQLWEQDGASVGNYHAGRAAEAPDASTAYYNPAGLIRIHNQQVVFGLDPVITDFKFRGTVGVSSAGLGGIGPQPTVAQGGTFNIVPSLNYAAPLNDQLVFGFSIVSPFGLKTDYGSSTPARYAATLTSLQIIDISPSLGMAINDKFSIGAGIDIEHARGEFDLTAGNPLLNFVFNSNMDSQAQNIGTNYGYGYHLGALLQFNENTRVGLSYHSKIVQHLEGSSTLTGPLANDLFGGQQRSTNLRANATMPATTTLSAFHTFNPKWDMMGTVIYTQWNEFSQLVLQNVSAILDGASSNQVTVIIPESYRNSWNYSVGANYHANEQWMLRAGLGFDETPSRDSYRNLQLPDSDRIAVALGTHYQATKTLGFDAGWTHFFIMNTRINNISQPFGDQTSITNGSTQANADVFGLQVKWDIL
jgi:long-chain fatty acid transport protein